MDNKDICDLIESHGVWGMSDFQSRYFVVNSHVTDYKRVKQAFLEIETRIGAKKQMERNIKKCLAELRIKQRDLDNEKDELYRELILIDIDQLEYDKSVYEKKLKVCQEELDIFCNIVKEIVPDAETLKSFTKNDEDQEKIYWITRMAKQAALDLFSTGRIGQGNLDSIAMMSLEDQHQTITTALKYNGILNKGISVLERTALEEISHLPSNIKYVENLVNKLKLEDKTAGEDI